MAATPLTPRRTANGKRRGRPPGSTNAVVAARKALASAEPPAKRRKYIPGGPGGGGRFVDEDGVVTQVVGSGSGRRGRDPTTRGVAEHASQMPRTVAEASPLHLRRERSTRTRTATSRYESWGRSGGRGRSRGSSGVGGGGEDSGHDNGDHDHDRRRHRDRDSAERFGSAAAVAAAVVQSEGYKPREERGWEEFHPHLDIETTFMVFRSDDVDGTAATPAAVAATPATTGGPDATLAMATVTATTATTTTVTTTTTATATDPPMNGAIASTEAAVSEMPDGAVAVAFGEGSVAPMETEAPAPMRILAAPETPLRRRIGRPPREQQGMTPKTPKVLPIHNQTPKEKLDLKQPSYRKTDRIQLFEGKAFGRYVDKSMMNVGYQETDLYLRPEGVLIKASDANAEEELEAYQQLLAATGGSGGGKDDDDGTVAAALAASTQAGGIGEGSGGSSSSTERHGGVILPGGGAGSNGGVGRVEYDMDEQDDMWLSRYNGQRKAAGVEAITREMFEIAVTKIEKEWHALEKRIPKPNPKPPQTHRPRSSSAAAVNGETGAGSGEEPDSKCAICDDGDCENTNAIVFCDGCDLAVHQDCYGVPFIPEGQWLCRKCQLIGRGIPTCIFCPNTDGAFKQTNASKWAHMLCAMWIPETSLGNMTFMEPVMDVDKVPKTRWRLTCYICRQKMGACIQCGNKACYQAFHVTCARRARLYLRMKNSQGALAVLDNSMVLKALCDRHCPPDYAADHGVHQATREAKRFYKRTMRGRLWADSRAPALQMATRVAPAGGVAVTDVVADGIAGNTTSTTEGAANGPPGWKLPSGAPVIPQAVFDIVETALQRFMLRRRREFVSETCRYWTLKREARRGAALLKRLQLQMETCTSMELTRRNFAAMGTSGRARLARRIAFAETLRDDLAQLRSLAAAVVRRERDKLNSALLEQDFVDVCYFPVARLLAPIVPKARSYDKAVFDIGLQDLQTRLDARQYTNALAFAHDLAAVIRSGIHAETSVVAEAEAGYTEPRDRKRLAKRILRAIQPMLEAAVRAEADLTHVAVDGMLAELETVLEASVALPAAGVAVTDMTVGDDGDVAMADRPAVDDGGTASTGLAAKYGEPLTPPPSHNGNVPAGGTATGPTARATVGGGHRSGGVPDEEGDDGDAQITITITTATPAHGNTRQREAVAEKDEADERGRRLHSTVDTLDGGGRLWHLSAFRLRGTTAEEQLWAPGQDAIRSLSEDLTDMDEEELNGLGRGLMEGEVEGGGGGGCDGSDDSEDKTIAMAATPTPMAAVAVPSTPRRRGAAAQSAQPAQSPTRRGTRSSARSSARRRP